MTRVGGLVAGSRRPGVPEVVLLPGLGLVGYLRPLADAVGAWTRCVVLDLPGFGSRQARPCAPVVEAVGAAAAEWLRERPEGSSHVLVGHSTGAQSALAAAALMEEDPRLAALVMLGPTTAPSQRSRPAMLAAALRAYDGDDPRQVGSVLGDLARGRRDVVRYWDSGIRDRPEERIGDVRVPVVLAAGRADGFSPGLWLDQLARRAHAGRALRLPGSHNMPWTRVPAVDGLLRAVALGAAASQRTRP